MLGYSDSGKDSASCRASGRCTWRRSGSPRQAAEQGSSSSSSTAAAARPRAAAAVRYRAILAQPRGSLNGRIRITEQGETSRRATATRSSRCARWSRRSRRCCWPPRARAAVPEVWRAAMDRLRAARASLPGAGLRGHDFPRFFAQVDADRGAGRPQHRLAAAVAGAAPAASSRCARSRGSSRGRRTGCCCRPGTARARRWREGRSTHCARWRALAVLRLAHLDARDGALQDRPRRRRALPAARRPRAGGALLAATSRDEYEQVVRRLLEITGAAALLDDAPARSSAGSRTATRGSTRSRTCRSSSSPAPAPGRRGRAGAAAGDDHRDRGGPAQHGLRHHAVERPSDHRSVTRGGAAGSLGRMDRRRTDAAELLLTGALLSLYAGLEAARGPWARSSGR